MRFLFSLILFLVTTTLSARSASEYLPSDADPDPAIPTPESVLGWEVGDWHISHDSLVNYMQVLADASPRVSLKVIGYTNERRPLLQLAITSEANQDRLETRQRVQGWPDGRGNHYLFDLNRHWLPLVNLKSGARVTEYHRWLPHVLTDHHEQEGYPGFFFQPGVPSRQNPLTPAENLELTRALAKVHARAMDEVRQPYFTKEAYDDYYFGKGSTFPDINGSIGILFEQKAATGQVIDSIQLPEWMPKPRLEATRQP